MQTINLKIAANDKLAEIQKNVETQTHWLYATIILAASTMFGLEYPAAIMIIVFIAWKQNKNLKEIKRMKDTYGL